MVSIWLLPHRCAIRRRSAQNTGNERALQGSGDGRSFPWLTCRIRGRGRAEPLGPQQAVILPEGGYGARRVHRQQFPRPEPHPYRLIGRADIHVVGRDSRPSRNLFPISSRRQRGHGRHAPVAGASRCRLRAMFRTACASLRSPLAARGVSGPGSENRPFPR